MTTRRTEDESICPVTRTNRIPTGLLLRDGCGNRSQPVGILFVRVSGQIGSSSVGPRVDLCFVLRVVPRCPPCCPPCYTPCCPPCCPRVVLRVLPKESSISGNVPGISRECSGNFPGQILDISTKCSTLKK